MTMKRKLGSLLTATAAGMVLLGSSSDASASLQNFDGYVCRVSVVSTDSDSVPSVSLYSQPGCTGSYLGYALLLSSNGNTSPEQTDRLLQGFMVAVSTDTRVYGTMNVFNIFNGTIRYIQSLNVASN